MLPSQWAAIYNAFNPFEPVPPDKMNQWFVTRPGSPLELLVRQFSPDRLPGRRILVGQPSSGKSSELTKLAAELQRRYGTLVVRLDLDYVTDVHRANPVDVLFLMGAALFKVATAELPPSRHPERQLLENHRKGLETLVRTHTRDRGYEVDLDRLLDGLLVFGGAALAGPVGATAGAGLSGVIHRVMPFRFKSSTDVEVVRRIEVEPSVIAMLDSLNAIVADVQVKADRPIVMLVDGLDKLRDLDVISVNFLEKEFLSRPTCNVLYTGPLDLYYSPEFGRVRARFPIVPFSQVKLHHRDNPDQPDKEGYPAMRHIVRRRLKSLGWKWEEVIAPDVLDLLIEGSGGVLTDFVRLVQTAALQAEVAGAAQIGISEASKALNELRRQLMAQLTPKYRDVLDQVRSAHQRVDSPKCDLLLRNNMVVSYFNDDVWYDAHAALTDKPW
jgi:hypothetical protein